MTGSLKARVRANGVKITNAFRRSARAGRLPDREERRPISLSADRVAFFDAFGYLVLRNLLNTDVDRVARGFGEATRQPGWRIISGDPLYDASRTGAHDAPRVYLPFLLDCVPALAWMRNDLRLRTIARALLGPAATYAESDGNLYNCDTAWHHDAFWVGHARHVKFMIYLDPLEAATGALRIVPGSHLDGQFSTRLRRMLMGPESIGSSEQFGMDAGLLPAQIIEVVPGDVVVLDFRTFHASFGGKRGRRVITINFGPPETRIREGVRQFVQAATTPAPTPALR